VRPFGRRPGWGAEEFEVAHRKRVAAREEGHEAGVRRQKDLLRELGVPDVSLEEVTERAPAAQRRHPS